MPGSHKHRRFLVFDVEGTGTGIVSPVSPTGRNTLMVSTESLIDARIDQAKAETDTAIARALLTIQESAQRRTHWAVGMILGGVAAVGAMLGVLIAVLD